jgi:hypothetical protein
MFDYAFFDTRFYRLVQSMTRDDDPACRYHYRATSSEPDLCVTDPADFCLSTEMTPGDTQEYENWYRQEHLEDVSKIKGWRRTERYELVEAFRAPDAPTHLTLVGNQSVHAKSWWLTSRSCFSMAIRSR